MDVNTCTYIKLITIGFGVLIGFFQYNKLSPANKLFFIFLIVALAGEILEFLMAIYFRNNYPLYHVFRPLYYSLLTIALSKELKVKGNLFFYSIPVVAFLAILNGRYFQNPFLKLNTTIISLTCILLILQVLFYVTYLLEHHSWHETIYQFPFWISMGILVSSISSFLTLVIHNLLTAIGQFAILPVQFFSELIFYGTFILSFILQKNATRSNQDYESE